ncbi:RiPP maturation radical SAM C-methyltransferase [Kitasatospora sp. NPDC059571]|uniref:RiPP maturation radical SAM C-methyltransferase n=1 Tax=Kitasatospora sp. NPDC059571 TaxID=3346871 RepID=UPI0036AECB22
MTFVEIGPPPPSSSGRVVPLRVLLVSMPWASLDMPSLALSTLTPLVRDHAAVASVDVLYANLQWADYVYTHTEGRIGEADFNRIARGDFVGTGEWVFSSALYDSPQEATAPEDTPFYGLAASRGAELAAPAEMYSLAPGFVRELARTIASGDYDLVGLTTTFDQNIASLALLRQLSLRKPELVTVLGGANCDSEQGAALHRNFPFLDYVVRGEAEQPLSELLQIVAECAAGLHGEARASRLREIAGLCWRDGSGRARVNAARGGTVTMDAVPTPDFSAYFEGFEASEACRHLLPKVPLEGGRGCWWGQKHHCTFCGLNGTLMTFRSKSPERVLDEIVDIVGKHRTLDLLFADNILDMRYLSTLLPRLGALGWDLRLFFEVKSNLNYRQLLQMADGGVTQIQPGIENLSTRVLELMRKGVTGWQNVRLLRDCRSLGILPSWNVLYGFPGESWSDYRPIIDRIGHLTHLTPPDLSARIRLTRFSPYFTDPTLGLDNQGPSALLSAIYRLPTEELRDLVYVFDSTPAGIDDEGGAGLDLAIRDWQQRHVGARLVALEEGDRLRIVDERDRRSPREHLLDTPMESAAYRELLKGRTADVLRRRLTDAGHRDAGGGRIEALLTDWHQDGLVFRDGAHYVALATGMGWS